MTQTSVTAEHQDCEVNLPPCPFCGKQVDIEDPDTLYPSGIFWRHDSEIEMRTYHRMRDRLEGDGACYGMHCPVPSGGCGAQITGDSKEEAISAWNKRA